MIHIIIEEEMDGRTELDPLRDTHLCNVTHRCWHGRGVLCRVVGHSAHGKGNASE